ncbi:MAG: hypothetical protein OEZ06_30225 [Myxococcales bacterium]|nr:hypothetical protein [Myxococcales bacterium]
MSRCETADALRWMALSMAVGCASGLGTAGGPHAPGGPYDDPRQEELDGKAIVGALAFFRHAEREGSDAERCARPERRFGELPGARSAYTAGLSAERRRQLEQAG